MKRIIESNENHYLAMRAGINAFADPVRISMGPRGRNVTIEHLDGSVEVSNDGRTIGESVAVSDPVAMMYVKIAQRAVAQADKMGGDGSSAFSRLLQEMVNRGVPKISLGVNPMLFRRGMAAATSDIIQELRNMAQPVKTLKELRDVARTSMEDLTAGHTIADIVWKIGKHGILKIENSPTFGVTGEIKNGMEIDRGYISPYFINNTKAEAEMHAPYILVTDQTITSPDDLVPIMNALLTYDKKSSLVIFAEDVQGDALKFLVQLRVTKDGYKTICIKTPGYGDGRRKLIEDLAIMVGARAVLSDLGGDLRQIEVADLGRADTITAKKDSTEIVGGWGEKDVIDARIKQLSDMLEEIKDEFEKDSIRVRLAKLSGGVGVISVGSTEENRKYLLKKVEDVKYSTKGAMESGIVCGGGVALVQAVKSLGSKVRKQKETDEFKAGYEMVLRSAVAPFLQIAENAGREDSQVLLRDVQLTGGLSGYDALNDALIPDMISAGIVDAVKVVINSFEHAATEAGILLTTEVSNAIKSEAETETAGGF